MPLVSLIGYRGTGKSTVAARLAARLGCPWHDADDELEAAVGVPIATLVRDRGEPVFRDEEARILLRLLERDRCILSTGGGVVLREENRAALRTKGGLVVWLTAPADVIRRRLAADPATVTRRPGLTGADPLAEIDAALEHREPLYRACASLVVDAGSLAPEAVVAVILARLAAAGAPSAAGGGTQA